MLKEASGMVEAIVMDKTPLSSSNKDTVTYSLQYLLFVQYKYI